MDSCAALFILEGTTDIAFVRGCLVKCHGAQETDPLNINFPRGRQREFRRSKFHIRGTNVGLFAPDGKEEARRAHIAVAREFHRNTYPQLRLLALVLDLNHDSASERHGNFIEQMRNLSRDHGTEFLVIQDQPAWAQVGRLKVCQVLLGDPNFGVYQQHTVEDHILQLLSHQPERAPSQLTKVVEAELGRTLDQKQQVLLSMVLEGYFGYPGGFYERVLNDTPVEMLTALVNSVGLDKVIEAVDAS